MTDGGTPEDDAREACERVALLHRIADVLNVPVTTFARDGTARPDGPTTAECVAVLEAFTRIRDPELRASCLRMLEACGAR